MFRSIVRIALSVAVAASVLGHPGVSRAAVPATGLMWFNHQSGEVSSWLLNGSGTVVGKRALDWRCDDASGCAGEWTPIGMGDLNNDGREDLLWHHARSGEVSGWLLNGGTVLGTQALSWRCGSDGLCSATWRPIGIADVNNDGNQNLMWYHQNSGEVSSWLLNGGGTVLGTQSLSWRCSYDSGCAREWYPVGVGDLNRDGHQDLTWYNGTTGVVSTWLLNSGGGVVTTQQLDWTCVHAAGCHFYPVAIGDVNGDRQDDLLWHNYASGQLSSWLLNGTRTVIAKQDLDWRCDNDSGCTTQWELVDLTS